MIRFLRITALILALLLIASVLSSCDWIDRIKLHLTPVGETTRGIPENNDREYVSLTADEYTYSSHYTPIHPCRSYQMLSEGQQALYDKLYHSVREVYPDTDSSEKLYKTKQVIVDDFLLSTADIRVAAKALYDDNPDLFWLSGTIYQLTDESGGYTAVQMRSIFSPEEILKKQKEITAAANAFYEEIPANLSPYAREKYVHDYIADCCEYDSEAAETHLTAERDAAAYIIYGALVEHKAVCEGYARSMQFLLNGLGVDCVGVTGLGYDSDGDEELHMWNAVCLNDDWYFVDPTWDDQLYDYRRYQYFNLDAKTMSVDHQPSPTLDALSEEEIDGEETFSAVAMNIFIPECTATQYQYYVFECPHLDDFFGEDVKDGLYRAALDQEAYLTVYIDPDAMDFDDALDALFKESPQYFFSYIGEVNGWLSAYEIDDSNLAYYSNKERSAVTIILNYY